MSPGAAGYETSSTNLIPFFQVLSLDVTSQKFQINNQNQETWNYTFGYDVTSDVDTEPVRTLIDAITCDQYITDYLEGEISQEEIQIITQLWYDRPQNYLCPDTDGFTVEGW